MSEHTLDARNILCPLPVIRTQDAIAELDPGDVLHVSCTDPGAINDIPTWCRINGHEVVGIEQDGRDIRISVRVGSTE
ncbi:tRNA 5-methylaminomethyl-2-thiouridine synthase TusA [Thiohalobacter thiocyanaticus]|uniref:tRNA 5-methylaminomethyl-2-thiouridine synthase TusA n=1 Tax=Thiohalobacter thiocyanaticus TaxID=585455 RepID=A0A1Z4VMK8_9GAMM|nr:sulfurtransferase TusA family protein [Thiohalobacter thiocyanaticus]BAZ92588.1 tRNA 5-methylaminomethyl-2-thiouridine synthase TusA [Thiohalobacter thiocyanaticus]